MKTIGSRRMVFSGGAKKTVGGLTKEKLMKVVKGTRINKKGEEVPVYSIVSRKKNALGKTNLWADSIRLARIELQKKQKKPLGFIKIIKGGALYKLAMKIYKMKKKELKQSKQKQSKKENLKQSKQKQSKQ